MASIVKFGIMLKRDIGKIVEKYESMKMKILRV